MNDRSSRSHSVFQLHITGKNMITGENTEGYLNLIDLAGSEAIDRSGVVEGNKTEAININTSLFYLKLVIENLAKKK